MDYQPARALPICSLYTYVATDVCRPVTGSEVEQIELLAEFTKVYPAWFGAERLPICRPVIAIIIHLIHEILTQIRGP